MSMQTWASLVSEDEDDEVEDVSDLKTSANLPRINKSKLKTPY